MEHQIGTAVLTIDTIQALVENKGKLALSEEARIKIAHCRKYLDEKVPRAAQPIYGVNTGFGSLYNVRISEEMLGQLQYNLLVSHACGTGDQLPVPVVQLMLLLKIQSLSYGHSGVSVQTIERLIEMYNHEIYPVVYQQGSLGASGDLAPLAHLCLPMLGLGEVMYEGLVVSGAELLKQMQWAPLQLQSKEGLALLNGTQFMSAYGVYLILESRKLANAAHLIAAMSLDAYDGRVDAFHPLVHKIRAHEGQVKSAAAMLGYLEGSEIAVQPKSHVQDPYSFRCIPQVHGASLDTIDYVSGVFLKEINSVTDNPNIFPEEDLIISGGNFHGQPLALALDFLCIALAELGNISERRTYLLISGQRGLPPYLIKEAGINSGFMIPQYTAASIVSQNKQYCTPASADSIISSNGQEDHVSMGANAATKCYKVLDNLRTILAIEMLNACQALEFRRPLQSSPKIEQLHTLVRREVPFVETDTEMWKQIRTAESILSRYK
jgi:histidine ammonia-lyase